MTAIKASIDIGTNTVLGLFARPQKDGTLEVLEDHARVTRLGEGLSDSKELKPQAMERTLKTLEFYKQRADHFGIPAEDTIVLATAGMRRAANAQVFIDQVQAATGFNIQIIDGETEALYSYLGVVCGLRERLKSHPQLLIMDIGGGSTELIRASNDPTQKPHSAVSLLLGSVWFTEKFLHHRNPPTPQDLARMDAEIQKILNESATDWSGAPLLVGIAGTVTTLAAVEQQLKVYDAQAVHGSTLTPAQIEALVERIEKLSLADLQKLPGLQPERADVIVAGVHIALAVLRKSKSASLLVSDQGLRYGVLYERLSPR